jgi:DNA-binding response OmpR family regulator
MIATMRYTQSGFSISALRRTADPILLEPMVFGDDRISVGPRRNELTVDYHTSKLTAIPFQLLYSLVERVDEPVSYGDLIKGVWGWDALGSADITRFRSEIRNNMSRIRKQLGPELGNPSIGAIQTIDSVGYIALKHLQTDDSATGEL